MKMPAQALIRVFASSAEVVRAARRRLTNRLLVATLGGAPPPHEPAAGRHSGRRGLERLCCRTEAMASPQ